MKKEKIRTEQLYCDHKDGVCLRPLSTKIVTKRSLFAGRLISFLVFNSILNLEKVSRIELYIILLIPATYKDLKCKG